MSKAIDETPRTGGGSWRKAQLFGLMLLLAGAGAAIGVAITGDATRGIVSGGAVGFAVGLFVSGVVAWRWSGESQISCDSPTPASRRLGAQMSLWMAVYVLAVVLISWVFDIETLPLWARIAAGVTPALPIGGVIYALIRHLSTEPDEFQRLLTTRAVLIASGVTFFIVTAWGFLEVYADAPHFPTLLVMVPFWLVFGVATVWQRMTDR